MIGARLDYYHFDVEGVEDADTGKDDDVIASPKGNLILGPWFDSELYLSAGMGFHSNDARGVTASKDAADPLVRTYGAEIGVRTSFVPDLHSTAAFWWLDSDSELVFVGDAGETTATRPSRRYGVELANFYSPLDWLTFDVDYAWSHTRFRDHEPEGDYVPGSIENVVGAGVTVHDIFGLLASLRLRYFGPRPLIEDDSERSHETIMVGALLAYDITDTWRITGEVFNLLDRDDAEIDYFYPSCLQSEIPPTGSCPADGGIDDIHFHPVYPITFRGAITARF